MVIMRMGRPGATSRMVTIPIETGNNIQVGNLQIYPGTMVGTELSWEAGQDGS